MIVNGKEGLQYRKAFLPEQENHLECYTLISYIILLKRYVNVKAFKAEDGNVTPKLKSSTKGGKNFVKEA